MLLAYATIALMNFRHLSDTAAYSSVTVSYSPSSPPSTLDTITYSFNASWTESGYNANWGGLEMQYVFLNSAGTEVWGGNVDLLPVTGSTTSPVNISGAQITYNGYSEMAYEYANISQKIKPSVVSGYYYYVLPGGLWDGSTEVIPANYSTTHSPTYSY